MEEKKFCKYCGAEVESNASFCPHCGGSLETTSQQAPGYNENQTTPNNAAHPVANSTTDYGIIALVFGILSIALGGFLWAILTFVFAAKAPAEDSKAKVGKILAIIGIITWIILLVIVFVTASAAIRAAYNGYY